MNRLSLLLGILGTVGFATPVSALGTPEKPEKSQPGLRASAEPRAVFLGAAVRPEYLEDETYSGVLADNFNYLTPENDLKWEMIRPSPTKFDFSGVDVLADFAKQHNMVMRGHTLVWHNQNPGWLRDLPEDKNAWAAVLKKHITTVVGEYRGRIRDWDVVNEVITDDGKPRATIWSSHLGENYAYVDLAFTWAREADPDARLFINDYGTEYPGPKSDALYALVKALKARGVPIDGIGFQAHLDGTTIPDFAAVQANFQRFADLGLEVQITELDVRMPGVLTKEALDRQALIYAGMLRTLRAVGGHTFVIWGFTDLRSWVPGFFSGYGAALPFDADYQAKPAVAALRQELDQK